jgi:hypothetical protein
MRMLLLPCEEEAKDSAFCVGLESAFPLKLKRLLERCDRV